MGYVSGKKPDTAAVKAALETTYACLGITCAQVGGLLNSAKTEAEAGMEACDDRGLPSESPTPPFSPPPSSPAPPPNKLPSESRYSVSAQVTIVGSVSDYALQNSPPWSVIWPQRRRSPAVRSP